MLSSTSWPGTDGVVTGATVVITGATVVATGATVVVTDTFVVAGCPLPAYVYLIDVIADVLFSFTVATPTVYSPAPFVNIEASKSATFSVTFVTYTPSM